MAWDTLCRRRAGFLVSQKPPGEGWVACISCPQLALGLILKGPWAVQLREAMELAGYSMSC